MLERAGQLTTRDSELPQTVGPRDVKIAVHTVGICGSDVHCDLHGGIGDYIVKQPMVPGHEGAGTIAEVGSAVATLKTGDRVCMESGIPDLSSRATKLGIYNVDPAVAFRATPPGHGILTPFVIHPEAFTCKLPGNASFAEAAMVEPFGWGCRRPNGRGSRRASSRSTPAAAPSASWSRWRHWPTGAAR